MPELKVCPPDTLRVLRNLVREAAGCVSYAPLMEGLLLTGALIDARSLVSELEAMEGTMNSRVLQRLNDTEISKSFDSWWGSTNNSNWFKAKPITLKELQDTAFFAFRAAYLAFDGQEAPSLRPYEPNAVSPEKDAS